MERTGTHDMFDELAPLFFEARQIIRDNLRGEKPDPNAWLRYETLRFVAHAKHPSMQDVAKHLRVRAPSATSLIAHLIRQRLLARQRAGTDKRVVRVALTKTGERMLAGYRRRSSTTMRRVFSKLPAKDVAALARILRRTRDAHKQ